MRKTLITGATGFLGRHLLWDRLRDAKGKDRVLCLIRSGSDTEAEKRLRKVLNDPSAELTKQQKAKAIAVRGDIAKDLLGMDDASRKKLAKGLTDIIHCAASVSFTLAIKDARNINVGGTKRMLELARLASSLKRFDYVGTAYVAGTRSGLVKEDELRHDIKFNNTYEQTKAESEQAVRDAAADLPVTIFRPSVVVGDSRTGITQSFNVMYWPLKVFSRKLVVCIPANPDCRVDIVPIDFVTGAIDWISSHEKPSGKTYHLAVGPKKSETVEHLAKTTAKLFNVWMPPFVSPEIFYKVLVPIFYVTLWGSYRRVMNIGRVYIPYLTYKAVFDTTNTEKALLGSGISTTSVGRFFDLLMRYCMESDWGKKPLSPERLEELLEEDIQDAANM